jgi:hypothetical protein
MLRAVIILLTLSLVGAYAQTGFSKTMSVTGNLPRDLSQDYFDLEIKVTDITKTTPASGEDLFKDRIRIWLMDLSSSTSEYVPFEGDPVVTKVPFTVRLTSDINQTPNAGGLTDFTYNVRISANNVGGLKDTLLTGSKTSTILQVYYYEEKKPQPEVKTENKTITINTAIVKAAPTNVTSSGTHRAIRVKWSAATTTTWSDGSSQAPSKVIAVAIDQSAAITNLPAYLYDSSAATDTDAADDACVYVPDNDTCVQCSDTTKHYLNPTKLGTLSASGVFVATAPAIAGEVAITGLENGKSYSVFTFYTPGGLERSSCQTASAVANTTWSEHNGEGDAKLGDPKCFIATAAYGSPLDRHLKPLRWFRDRVLLKSKPGQAFVEWYYEHGPQAASVVAAHPVLKVLVRSILWLPVMIISTWMTLSSDANIPVQTTLVVICTILAMASYLLIKRARGGVY